jgi:GH43 family beta-xylosidase
MRKAGFWLPAGSRKWLELCSVAVLLLTRVPAVLGSYVNPITTSGADPFVLYTNGYYYFLRTTGGDVRVVRSTTLQSIGSGTEVIVFRPNNIIYGNIWAPELHYLDGKWYIYSTGSVVSGQVAQRLFVLEGNSQDPMGAYTFRGILDTSTGQLDATALVRDSDGAKFLVWSQWDDMGQSLYLAPLPNPWTLGTPRLRISTPTYSWEKNGNVNEGPIVLKRGGKTFIVYSASGTWTPDYCLGLLVNTDGNYTNAASWTKFSNPIFRRRDVNGVYCVGHNSFTRSPGGLENWIVYHGTSDPAGDQTPKRNVRIQKFIWNSDDTPNLDVPLPSGLAFASPDEAPGVPIRGLRGEYFNNSALSGTPVVLQTNATMDFDWGTGSASLGVAADGFSVRWSGTVLAPNSGTYTFQTVGDDGIRLWVNGQLLVNDWNTHPPATNAATITLAGGQFYSIRMDYFENVGGALCRLSWIPPSGTLSAIPCANLFPSANGLRAEYFSGTNFNSSVLTRSDPCVNFDWGTGRPEAVVPTDSFSVRWMGSVRPAFSETYTFQTISDDGVRLWVNHQLLLDNWTVHARTTNLSAIPLVAGQLYDLRMDYFENGGGAVAELEWSSPSQPREVIPQSRLFLPVPGLTPSLKVLALADQQVRIFWPGPATGYSLQRSSSANGPYADSGLTVWDEGGENVAYDSAGSSSQFYRLSGP